MDPATFRAAAYKYANRMSQDDPERALGYYKLLLETANQESLFGELSKSNPLQVDAIQEQELSKSKYADLLGSLDLSSARTPIEKGMGLAAATYLSRGVSKDSLTTPEERAQVWKKKYNTSAGKGTVGKYLQTNKGRDYTLVDKWWRAHHGSNSNTDRN